MGFFWFGWRRFILTRYHKRRFQRRRSFRIFLERTFTVDKFFIKHTQDNDIFYTLFPRSCLYISCNKPRNLSPRRIFLSLDAHVKHWEHFWLYVAMILNLKELSMRMPNYNGPVVITTVGVEECIWMALLPIMFNVPDRFAFLDVG